MADITANVDAWSTTEGNNAPSGATTIGTGLNDNFQAVQAAIKIYMARLPQGQGILLNGRITAAVAASALTLAVKGKDGNDPSSTNKVYVAFRSSTASSSDWNIREITSALSVVVSSGSTLGHASGIVQHLFVYLIDNAGTVEMAVSNLPPDYPGTFGPTRLISTTAEGGAGAADSATGIYSTTARSNVSWICAAMLKSTQATAGTWATTPSQIDMAPFGIPSCTAKVTMSGTQSVAHSSDVKLTMATEIFDHDGVFDNATNYRYQPNVAGLYDVKLHILTEAIADATWAQAMIFKNGTYIAVSREGPGVTDAPRVSVSTVLLMNGTSDYVEFYTRQSHTANATREYLGGEEDTSGIAYRISCGRS